VSLKISYIVVIALLQEVHLLQRRKILTIYKKLSSGNFLPIIALVIIPFLTISLTLFSEGLGLSLGAITLYTTVMIYAPYRAAYSTEEFFKRRGYENVINEYNNIKYILFFIIPLFIVWTIFFLLTVNNIPNPASTYLIELFTPIQGFTIQFQLTFVVIAGLLKITLLLLRKEFRVYFAKGCLTIALKKQDDVEKMKYLIWGLNSYNFYLRRHLKLEIQDPKRIYSKISNLSYSEKNKIIHSLLNAFEFSKLQPLAVLSSSLNISDLDQFLVKESFIRTIKESAALAAVIIPIAISIIQLIMNLPT
jgi:hypothetical protein